jgi:type IV secretion system protein VirB6
MTHCTQTDLSDYQYTSSITSPYFSAACFNFVGDSQNMMAYGTGFIAGSARHFGAPIAQCTKETIENIFYNRAGHTACRLIDDAPSNNNCPGGTLYRKGDQVQAASFFSILQNQMQFVVKLILTFSIIFYGAKILLGGGGIKSSELIMYIVKIALIMYFATGDAWQSMFFDGVYGASTVFSQMVFKIQTPPDLNKRDGCQFGNVNLDDDNSTPVSVSTYPPGKGYLAMWDALDCKMTRYLGFGPELSTANIVKLIIAGYLTGPIGIYFSVALLFFGLVMVSAVIRALQIFLSSCIAIVIMVYLSPLIFPLALFEKTKGIFKGWVTQVISFSLQPMILFAYLAIFVSIMDKTLIGSATFYGIPPARGVQCSEYCQDAIGNVVNNPNCDAVGQKLVVPKADSVACMISNDAFGNWPGLELIGIGLPFLIDFFAEHTREKILTIMKAALIMYFLMKFMDEIPGITSQLIGGATLPASSPSAAGMMKSITGVLKGIQQRANRATLKWGGKGATGARSAINRILSAGDKGKSVSPSEEGSGSDDASSSKSGGKQDDAGSSQGGSNSASSSSPGGGESSSSSSKDESSA